MRISKKEWDALEKRVADLEKEVQGQRKAINHHLESHVADADAFKTALEETKENLVVGITAIKNEIIKAALQELNHSSVLGSDGSL